MSPCQSLLAFTLAWCLPTVFPCVISVLWICLLSIHFLLHRTTTRRRLGSGQMSAGLPGLLLIVSLTLSQRLFYFHLELGIITPTSSGCEEDWRKYSQCLASKSGISVSGQLPSCATLVNNAAPFRKRQFTSLGCYGAQLTQGNVDLLKSLRKVPIAMFSSRKSQGLVYI